MRRCVGLLAAAVLAGAMAAGCDRPQVQTKIQPALYQGPLASVQEVVGRLSAQNAQVRTVWARHEFGVKIVDRKGRETKFDGDGVLMLRKPVPGTTAPLELSLTGSKDVMGEVFAVGANTTRAWLILRGEVDTMYWFNQNSQLDLDPATLPARPDQLADMLGLGDVSTDLGKQPYPVMTFDPEQDSYVLRYIGQAKTLPPRLEIQREIYVGRTDFRPRQVVIYGPDGRVSARSILKKWAVLEGSTGAVPTDIEVVFPLSRSAMRFVLREAKVTHRGFPKDASFLFPSKPGVEKIEQLDAPAGVPPPRGQPGAQ